MKGFKKRGLDIKYQKEIEEWKKNKREKEYNKRMEKQANAEMERYLRERDKKV